MEDGGEAGHPALDLLLDHDVGRVEAGVGIGGRAVVDLDHGSGAIGDGAVEPGQRLGAGRSLRWGNGARGHDVGRPEVADDAAVDALGITAERG